MSLKVLIVDDHEVARIGISYLLEGRGFVVRASVGTGGEAIALVKNNAIDVVLLDVRMPNTDGLAILERIREAGQELAIVILSTYDNPTYIARAAAMGASDYLLKSGSSSALSDSLVRAAGGQSPPSSSPLIRVRRMMREEVDASTLPPEFPLTSREAQVLRHIALGLSNKEIARSLSISVETVKEHVQNILRKIRAHDRTDAAVRAIKSGLLD
jgi:DNA-binding NarL/FixJ family response regulator